MNSMGVSKESSGYFSAAQIDAVPHDLSKPRHISVTSARQRLKDYQTCVTATEIWNSADTDNGRRFALESSKAKVREYGHPIYKVLKMFLQGDLNRLPSSEIENELCSLGLKKENNEMLSGAERDALDRDGYLNLGPLIDEKQIERMRDRYDTAVDQEGARPENAEKKGIARLVDTVVKPINRDGLLDPIFTHPRLLAAVRHILGLRFKYIGSNYHCALPGYGHQGIHADFMWGVKGEPQVVNAVWMIDEFTEDNGATRIVPGTHLSGVHPTGDMVNGKPRDLNAHIEGEVRLTGTAGCCVVYNAHLWHGGTQNCTNKLRRAQHAFFSRSHRPSSTDVPVAIDPEVHKRFGKLERAILDIE